MKVSIVSIKGNTCSFRIHSFRIIIENILSILDEYFLLTHKLIQFKRLEKIYSIKIMIINSRFLGINTLNKIVDLKNGMNNLRTNYEGYILSNRMVNKNWLVGFVEGDGTFYFSNSSVVFGITQKDKKY